MKNSTDIWFNIFLLMKGQEIMKHESISSHKVRCFWNLDEFEWTRLKLEFANSEVSNVKALFTKIKDLGY